MAMMTTTSKITIRKPHRWSTSLLGGMVTSREKEVLQHIANGDTSVDIAESLFISEHTVLSHRKNLLVKLEARNTAHLVMKGVRMGLL